MSYDKKLVKREIDRKIDQRPGQKEGHGEVGGGYAPSHPLPTQERPRDRQGKGSQLPAERRGEGRCMRAALARRLTVRGISTRLLPPNGSIAFVFSFFAF